jgi:hypothetical protein
VGTLAFVPPLLRYGVFELLLVQPLIAGSWRAPDTPWEGPWPPEDFEGMHTRESIDRAYRDRLARKPETLTAPASWPAELALLTLEAFELAWLWRMTGWRQWLSSVGPLAPVKTAVSGIRTVVERDSARHRGIVASAAPRPRVMDAFLVYVSALSVGEVVNRVRGRGELTPPPWPFATASIVVRGFNRRRSWERAYAAARASQDLSSASSSTSEVCAPDTP